MLQKEAGSSAEKDKCALCWVYLQGNEKGVQTSDFRDIYLNRIAEKVNQYLSGCVPVDEKYGT